MNQKYYAGIDSLRALAVCSVVLYHLDSRFLGSGFLGVDIFFVISGFVVSLAMSRIEAESFTQYLSLFYVRRIRRIMPALVACLLVSSLLACLFVPRSWLGDMNANAGVSAFFGLSNFLLAKPTNEYFSPRSEFNLFTHTWSLAVEEQFYLAFPFVMYVFYRSKASGKHSLSSPMALAALSLVSLAVCAYWTAARPTFAFYLTPSRFWELAAGMGLQMTMPWWQPRISACPDRASHGASWLCVAILVAVLIPQNHGGIPFPRAIVPVLATAALLALIVGKPASALPSVFSAAPIVAIGRISYSLYLWHWPIFVLFRWTVGLESPLQKFVAASLSVVLAVVSYRWVELPTRHARLPWMNPRWRFIAVSAGLVALSAGASSTMFRFQDQISLSVTSEASLWLPDGGATARPAGAACRLDIRNSAIGRDTFLTFTPTDCPQAAAARRVFVLGDSHATAYIVMMSHYAEATGSQVVMMTKPGCPVYSLMEGEESSAADCQAFSRHARQALADELQPGDTLFLPSLRVNRFVDQWGPIQAPVESRTADAARRLAVSEAVDSLAPLAARGAKIVFELPKPLFKAPPFRCADWFDRDNPICRGGFTITRTQMEAVREPAVASIAEISARVPNVSTWDPLPVLCPTPTCHAFRDGRPMYFDGDHLSEFGNLLLVDSFTERIRAISPG